MERITGEMGNRMVEAALNKLLPTHDGFGWKGAPHGASIGVTVDRPEWRVRMKAALEAAFEELLAEPVEAEHYHVLVAEFGDEGKVVNVGFGDDQFHISVLGKLTKYRTRQTLSSEKVFDTPEEVLAYLKTLDPNVEEKNSAEPGLLARLRGGQGPKSSHHSP